RIERIGIVARRLLNEEALHSRSRDGTAKETWYGGIKGKLRLRRPEVPVIWQVDQETFETFGGLGGTGKVAPLLRQTLLAQSILGVGGVSRSPVGCRRPLKSICNESAKFRGHRVSSCDNGDWQLTIAPRHTKGWALSCGMPSLSVSGYFQFP